MTGGYCSARCERLQRAAPQGDRVSDVELVYFAHRVGAATAADVRASIASAEAWLAWLVAVEPDVAIVAPWLPYVRALDDHNAAHRGRGIRDGIAIIRGFRRLAGIALCGPEISSGMRDDAALVLELGGWVADLTGLLDDARWSAWRWSRVALAEGRRRHAVRNAARIGQGAAP